MNFPAAAIRDVGRAACLALALVGCARAAPPAGPDAAATHDATADVATHDAPTDTRPDALHGPYTALARARDRAAASSATATTWLLAGSRQPTQNAILLEPQFVGDALSLATQFEIAGTAGREPMAAARSGDRVVGFLQRSAAAPELVLLDGTTGAVLATASLTGLTAGTPQYAWLALRGDWIVCAAVTADEALLVQTFVVEPGALRPLSSHRLEGYFAAALEDASDGTGVVLAAIATSDRMDLFRVLDDALVPLAGSTASTVLPTSDGATLAALSHDRLVVAGEDLGPLPPAMQIDGNLSVATTDDGGLVVALVADAGRVLIGARRRAGDPIAWTEVPAGPIASFRGWVAAHADAQHLGVFYLETFLGTEPPALQYFGLPEGP